MINEPHSTDYFLIFAYSLRRFPQFRLHGVDPTTPRCYDLTRALLAAEKSTSVIILSSSNSVIFL